MPKQFDPIRHVLNRIGWNSIGDLLDEDKVAAESRLIDLENTIAAIADPDDYETGGLKTLQTCQRIASECVKRNDI